MASNCHCDSPTALKSGKHFHCVTVGNPNAGKSTLFNALTGGNQHVGNWSGVTVEKKTGEFQLAGQSIHLTDLPGIYDLIPASSDNQGSLDEVIAQQFLADQQVDAIINLVDATNLERHLYLTVQLLELNIPMLVVINKIDVASKQGIAIDERAISRAIGCQVISANSKNPNDIKHIQQHVVELVNCLDCDSDFSIDYGDTIEEAIQQLAGEYQQQQSRGSLLSVLAQPSTSAMATNEAQRKQGDRIREELSEKGFDTDLALATARYQAVEGMCEQALKDSKVRTMTDRIDEVVLHPILGVPIFLLAMYLMFMFAINVGSAFIDFFDIAAGAIFVDHAGALMTTLGFPDWLNVIVAGGIGAGIQTVATFIPVIAALFLALSVMESSGYLSRAAFVIDGLMKRIGLPGKAFVPMIVGFGCSVPAIMATRTLGNERERIVTGMMTPFMSCGARLPVYALFAAAFFPEQGQNLVFLLYVLGILAAIGTGLMLRHTILPGDSSSSVMELPSYELPKFKAIMKRTGKRTKAFIKGAGVTIVIVVTGLNFVNSIGTDGSFGHEDSDESVLSVVSQTVTPVFAPMGVSQDNWPATVGIVTGIFAKEAVIGTLNSLYSHESADEEIAPLSESLAEAFATIPENLLGIDPKDPMSVDIGDVTDLDEQATELEVEMTTFTNLQNGFSSTSAAFAYLLFILLYTPCVAAIGALVAEFGKKWAAFAATWTFMLAYGSATGFYQIVNFSAQPVEASIALSLIVVVFSSYFLWLRKKGKEQQQIIPTMIVTKG
ncbi:Fe(2+) transporter permease subunit FeoB [Paraferrimonas haliotis]|uniref:Ferrous iron transport protein B n=1 Tax=Paraferrimonas haliotis TaxID=2013866 RepID=A0AA37TML5_9GAMM|nr:Fe(2+) transporter permease subunit FeoB [Paraferrimonas haliotis]GLS84247.1 ferrous iron transport protein B [Paraferrimonas haliotis]